nr:hypothetical protein CTI12_AA126620 [Tanacetum cinerariifolium]
MNSVRSKEDHVIGISKSVFVANFPDYFGSHDLWSLCEAYGKVVDVFIPNHNPKQEEDYNSVDDSVLGDHNNIADILHGHNGKGGGQESEDERVSKTIFGDNIKSSPSTNQNESQSAFVQQSDD